jgi:DNA-binding protein YbaB
MATLSEELAILELRASEGEGGVRLTLKGKNRSQSCSLAEAVTILKSDIAAGKGETKVHVVDHEAERQRKLTNPNKTTKRIFNCRTPEQWTELNKALEPYYEAAKDPHISIDLIVRALNEAHEKIEGWIHEGEGLRPEAAEALPGEEWINGPAREPGDEPEDELPEFLR